MTVRLILAVAGVVLLVLAATPHQWKWRPEWAGLACLGAAYFLT